MSAVAIIPARGGSERVPGKNIRPFCGKPLVAYSIEAAKASGLFERVYVSTESRMVALIAQEHGAAIIERPAELAQADVGTQEVMRYHADTKTISRYGYLCCLYATAPLLLPADLRMGFDLLVSYGADYAFSVGTDPLCDAGAFYWGKRSAFRDGNALFAPNSIMVPLPKNRVCDINTEADLVRARLLYEAMTKDAT